MAKARARARTIAKKDSVTLSRNAFFILVLFVVAITMLMAYAYLNFGGVR